jgi:hypothetical protein
MTDSSPQPVILDSLDEFVFQATSALAGMQLDVFTQLKDGPRTASEIAKTIGVEAIRLQPVLYALVIVGLLTVENGLFANTAEADTYLVRDRPRYLGDRQKYWSDIWSAALLTGASIRSGKPEAKHDYAAMTKDELQAFMQGLDSWAYEAGICLAEQYDFSSCRRVLDAAGGSGGLAVALTEAVPDLEVTVVEQPEVVPVTLRLLERAGVLERVRVEAVDLVSHQPSGSFDAAILKHFIQTLSIEDAHQALVNIRQVLEPGSTIYVWDIPLDESRLAPKYTVLLNSTFPAIYDHGQKRTGQEYRQMLTEAGFEGFVLDSDGVITARKPYS